MHAISDALSQALRQHQAGDLELAEATYRRLVSADPANSNAWGLLGALCLHRGRFAEAEGHLRRALELNPRYAGAYDNLGLALVRLGRPEEAINSYRQALTIEPNSHDTYRNLAVSLEKLGRHGEAVTSLRHALKYEPNRAKTHFYLGRLLHTIGQFDEAVVRFRRALQIKPDYAAAQAHLALALGRQGKRAEAVASAERVKSLQPNQPSATEPVALALAEIGHWEEATALFLKAIAQEPTDAHLMNNLGAILQEQGKRNEAMSWYSKALDLEPNLAEAHLNRALLWLARGDFGQGWPEFEWRRRCPAAPKDQFTQPQWDGAPLNDQMILLHVEQGRGDTIQFIRYAPLVKQRGGTVLVACSQDMVPLLRTCAGVDRLVVDVAPPFDVHVPLMSLPGIFQTGFATIPAAVPYLSADPDFVRVWREKLRGIPGFRVGIAWQGNPKFRGDSWRSIPLRYFAELGRLDGVRLISLQKGLGTEQLRYVVGHVQIHELGPGVDETSGAFMDTAAIIRNLDLVITSDSAIAHLAGALGARVWLALPLVPDWRWFLERDDSPWYPTMRLFRQEHSGDWEQVFRTIADELRRELQ